MKISLERLLVESSKLQDHRQQSCVIRNVTVESVASSGHHVKTNATAASGRRRYGNRSGIIQFEQDMLTHWESKEVVAHGANLYSICSIFRISK